MMDAAAIIRDIASVDAPSEEVVTFVLDRAEGVPLFLEELTRSALELGLPADPLSIQGQSGEDEIPSSLQSSLLARLDRLGTAREIAQIASTIGREFGFQLLQEVSGVPESEVRTALSDLVCAGLIVPKDAVDGSIYVFRHALFDRKNEERRVGKECVSTCRYRWSTSTEKKKIYKTNKNKKN